MTLPGRIHAVMQVCVLALLAALLLLTQQAERTRQADMEAQLDGYLLSSLRTTAENFLSTGLQLEQMEALQGVIEREQASFARVVAIDVYAASGSVLYSTDVDSRGRPVPDDWRRYLAQEQPWHAESLMLRQIGQRFDNDLGQAAGGIVITLSTAPAPQTLEQWKQKGQQGLQWLMLAALACLVAWACVYMGLKFLLRSYGDAARILQGGPLAQNDAQTTALTQAALRQRGQWQAMQQGCQQSMKQLEELDHEA